MNCRFLLLAMLLALFAREPLCAQKKFFGGEANRPDRSWVIDGFTDSVARALILEIPGSGIEGIWQTTSEGSEIAVISSEIPAAGRIRGTAPAGSVLFVVLGSPRPAIAPGTVMGWASPAAKNGKWDAWFFTRAEGCTLSGLKRFTLSADDDTRLQMNEVHKGVAANLWRLLPYMYRRVFSNVDDRERGLDGFLRVWPLSPSSPPARPVYL